MRRRSFGLSALVLLMLPAQVFAESVAIAAAQQAGKDWLTRLDAGRYAETWESAASMFKAAVSSDVWQQSSSAVRVPLGAVRTRKEGAASYSTTLPGVPDGEYVVMQFNTSFENKAQAIETVTATLEKDGTWRIAGYFIN